MGYTDLVVKGKMDFMGIDIPVVSGGFGEDKMCVSDKTIAEIHGTTTSEIRKAINRNVKRFKDGIDYIDLKIVRNLVTDNLLEQLSYSKMQIGKAEHIYILSERGYAKLIKIMDDDTSWDVHDKLVDNYFNMKEKLKTMTPQLTPKEKLQLAILNGDEVERLIALKEYEDVITAPLIEVIETQAPKVDFFDSFMNTSTTFNSTQVAKVFNIKSARKLNETLHNNGLIYKQGKNWFTYADVDNTWFKTVTNEYGTQLRMTAKGIIEISKLLDIQLTQDDLESLLLEVEK